MYRIKDKIGESVNVFRKKRRDKVIFARLRIGHTYITHSYLLKHEVTPWCAGCHEPYTVEHFMIKCIDTLHVIQDKYFSVNNMQTLFCAASPYIITEYVKKIGLYYEIHLICIFNLKVLTTDNSLLISIKQYYYT